MLTLRREQVGVFGAAAVQRFKDRMAAYIASAHPQRYRELGEEGTRELVDKGVLAGERYRLETEGAVAVLIELMVELGERLERSPDSAWAHEILELPKVPGQVKVTLIRDRLTERTRGRRIVSAGGAGPG